jgi:hypothetical protein
MADITADGKTRVYWVTTISNQNAPTTAELNAGISLQATLTADGLNGLAAVHRVGGHVGAELDVQHVA